jgi:hypothetical protein
MYSLVMTLVKCVITWYWSDDAVMMIGKNYCSYVAARNTSYEREFLCVVRRLTFVSKSHVAVLSWICVLLVR